MITIFWKPEGAKVTYVPVQELLTISDLNPEFERGWIVTLKELRQIAWRLLKASFGFGVQS